MEHLDHVEALSKNHPDLAAEVKGLLGMGGVMAWMKQRGIALAEAVIHQQDEFSLDFVVPLPGGQSLVFGIT
jgi:hypothetical protein